MDDVLMNWQGIFGRWQVVRDGDPRVFALARRHYSFHNYKRKVRRDRRVAGPGEKLVLLTLDGRALCIWRKFRDSSGQVGVCCALFRNEGAGLSSELLLEAEALARVRWPDAKRFYTYVDPARVRSVNPGYCFKVAGWKYCGRTKSGLVILEKLWV
jgi:hypothetical protein